MQSRKTTRNWPLAGAVAAMLAVSAQAVFAQAADPSATPPGPTAATPGGPTSTTNGPLIPGAGSTGPNLGAGTSGSPGASGSTTPSTDSTTSGTSSSTGSSSSSTTPTSGSMPMSGSATDSMGMPTDYKVLNNRIFDHVDLSQAEARGLSDSQIATVVKISKETGLPFNQVVTAVEHGATFPALASQYGLRLGDLYSVDKEKQQISDYKTLYASATSLVDGKGTMSSPMTPASASSDTSSTMPMSSSPTSSSASTSGASSSTSASSTPAPLDIVDTAMAAKNLTTLVKALQIAGLVETLKGTGPFTVFAPDDRAFSRLPAGTLESLEADPAKLKTILTYHVIPGSITSQDAASLTSPTSPPTVEGGTLQITQGRRGRLRVNNANVTKANIQASNGVIHIIDRVLLPPADTTTSAPTDTTAPAAPATPDATAPAAPATPDATAPGTTTPATPDTATPGAATPGTTTPGAATPGQ